MANRGQCPARPHRLPHQGAACRRHSGHGTGRINVLAAAGYENGFMRLWHLQSAPTVLTGDWLGFLAQLDGAPPRVVTDGHSGTIKAARKLWPDAMHWRSEWHLQDALHDYLRKAKLHGETREAKALRQAFVNRYWWEHFAVIAWRTGIPKLRNWLDDYGELV